MYVNEYGDAKIMSIPSPPKIFYHFCKIPEYFIIRRVNVTCDGAESGLFQI